MRADRLLSLMLLLQTRGKQSAQALAKKLEVSLRTVYRDVEALSTAGVPVYTEKGPGGGIALVENYRTSLTGLTPDEVRALFMLNIPAPLMQLGVAPELNSALLKLSAALPASRRADEERTRNRFHLDANWWSQDNEPVPYLQMIQEAVWQEHRLQVSYRSFFGTVFIDIVEPLGLVAKAGVWYMILSSNYLLRVLRVSDILKAEYRPEKFTRPSSFDIADFWQAYCKEIASRPPFIAEVRVSPALVEALPRYFGDQIRKQLALAEPDEQGWIRVSLPFEHFFAARERILGFGNAVEVLGPLPLRESVADFASQIIALYQGSNPS